MLKNLLTSWNQTIFNKLHNKMLLSYAIVILIPLLILGSLLYTSTISLSKNQIQENRSLEMKLLSQNLQQYFDSIELYSRVIYTEPVQQLLNDGYPEDLIEQSRWKSNLFRRFNEWSGYMGIKAAIQNVTIVRKDGLMIAKEPIYTLTNSFADETWYQYAYTLQGDIYVAGPLEREFTFHHSQSPFTFSLVRKINNSLGNNELGGIVIDINVMDVAKLLAEAGITNLTILNKNNQIVYSDNPDQIGQYWQYGELIDHNNSVWMDIDGEQMFVSSYYSEATGWRFVSQDFLYRIQTQSITFRNLTIGIGFLALFIALIISSYTSRRITMPIRTLQTSMKQVQNGNFSIYLKPQSMDEVGQLTMSFNRMTDKIYDLINNVYKSEIRRKEAQLKALQSQINPHFLYNTLDSMNAIAIIEDVPELSKMTRLLSEMFRYSISTGQSIVPLQEELKQINRYIDIQQIRYDDKFIVRIDIPDHLQSYPIPKLSLQPIVENAIYHGLELVSGEGIIEIISYETDSNTIIEVTDRGIGLAPDKLAKLQNELLTVDSNKDHIGIANVYERIQLHYGPSYRLAITSQSGIGTTVKYYLPLRKKQD